MATVARDADGTSRTSCANCCALASACLWLSRATSRSLRRDSSISCLQAPKAEGCASVRRDSRRKNSPAVYSCPGAAGEGMGHSRHSNKQVDGWGTPEHASGSHSCCAHLLPVSCSSWLCKADTWPCRRSSAMLARSLVRRTCSCTCQQHGPRHWQGGSLPGTGM